jgi:hypothetical protein
MKVARAGIKLSRASWGNLKRSHLECDLRGYAPVRQPIYTTNFAIGVLTAGKTATAPILGFVAACKFSKECTLNRFT